MIPYSFVIFRVSGPLSPPPWIRAWKELENNVMVTWQKHHIYSRATSSLILSEMIAELNRAQSTVLQNKDQNHTKKHKQWDRHTKQ